MSDDAELVKRLREQRDVDLHPLNFTPWECADAIERLTRERDEARQQYVDANEARIDAEAERDRLADLLTLYREAVRVDVTMEGLRWCGAITSALRRAWEADRALGEKKP